jgi:anthranilate phosphoribosyltransferase
MVCGAGRPSGNDGGSSDSVAAAPEPARGTRSGENGGPGSPARYRFVVSDAPGTSPTLDELGGWADVLTRLTRRADLGAAEAAAALAEILGGRATPVQITAFIIGLRCKGETVEELTGLVRSMLAAATPVPIGPELRARLVDTCGTGGDRSGSINVSTIAAVVVAGAGVPVCKHGGRAASSLAGSADVLEALGVVIDLGATGVARCIEEAGMGFCFAPRYHPAMRYATPVRRELGVPTVFNLLGPLANPARVRRQVVGVGDASRAATMAGVLAGNGATNLAVVHGADGLDELSTTGLSTMVTWSDGSGADPAGPVATTVDPRSLGLAPATPADLRGGDAATNAGYARRVLEGEMGPHRDIVALNAAAGLVVGGAAVDLAEGLVLATRSIDDGHALGTLQHLVTVSNDAAVSQAAAAT